MPILCKNYNATFYYLFKEALQKLRK